MSINTNVTILAAQSIQTEGFEVIEVCPVEQHRRS